MVMVLKVMVELAKMIRMPPAIVSSGTRCGGSHVCYPSNTPVPSDGVWVLVSAGMRIFVS